MEREIIRKYGNIEIRFNRSLLYQGIFLAILGLLGPLLLPQGSLHIYDDLSAAMLQEDTGALLTAAAKLVLMNVCRMTPHYMGAFMLNDAFHFYCNGRRRTIANTLFTYAMIFGIYKLIFLLYSVRYDFGFPAVLTIAFVLILSSLDLFSVSIWNKVVMVFTLLMSFQCLDVVPGLTEHGFGRGEVSMDVKGVARMIGQNRALQVFALSVGAVFFLAVIIQVQLLVKEHTVKITEARNRKVEKELHNTQLEALRMRNASEAQSLVHDLKTPLTTVQGLMSLAEMMEENPQISTYFGKMTASLENMDNMISEILYENKRDLFTADDLMRAAMAQVSIRIPKENLFYDNRCPDAEIMGNKIRLSRALVNLIHNAWSAVDRESGCIHVRVSPEEGRVRFEVHDNGIGIAPENLKKIWEPGYSGRGSTGLGLAFTRQVVENHGGTIEITSVQGQGTQAVISLPEAGDGEETLSERKSEEES